MTKETVKTEKATVYEVGYHIVPAVSPENLPKEVDAIKAVLGGMKATIVSEETPKLRNLAYTMIKAVGPLRHRYDTAYFGWVKFEASPESIADLKKAMDGNEKVLRYLIIKTVKENTLYGSKILGEERKEAKSDDGAAPAEVKEASAEEIDKSIDKLVV